MKVQDELIIANFVYVLITYYKLCKCDLDYAYNIFLCQEEYEKCSVLKEIINMKYYDNDKKSNYESVSAIINLINKFDDDGQEMVQYKTKLLQLKKELIDSLDEIETKLSGIKTKTIHPQLPHDLLLSGQLRMLLQCYSVGDLESPTE